MMNPPISELMKKVDSKFTLCIVIAKRSRRLLDGAHSLIKCNSEKPITIATNEFNEGKFIYIRNNNCLK